MQTFTRLSTAVVLAGAMASLTPAPASAQGIFGRMKDKAAEAAKRKVEERTERKAGEATDAALDKAECRVPGTKCDDSEKSESNGATATAATSSKSAKLKPGDASFKSKLGEKKINGDVVLLGPPMRFTKENIARFKF